MKSFVLAIKLDFLFRENFGQVLDFAGGTKTETKTEFDSDFVLKTKSNFFFFGFLWLLCPAKIKIRFCPQIKI